MEGIVKAVRIINSRPEFTACETPKGDGVLVKVASSSICGTDLHLMPTGMLEGKGDIADVL